MRKSQNQKSRSDSLTCLFGLAVFGFFLRTARIQPRTRFDADEDAVNLMMQFTCSHRVETEKFLIHIHKSFCGISNLLAAVDHVELWRELQPQQFDEANKHGDQVGA